MDTVKHPSRAKIPNSYTLILGKMYSYYIYLLPERRGKKALPFILQIV